MRARRPPGAGLQQLKWVTRVTPILPQLPQVHIRPAVAADAAACIQLRGQTRQNAFTPEALASLGITETSWAAGTARGDWAGRVAHAGGPLVGFCFGDLHSGELLVLALRPDHEGQGLGRELLQQVVGLLRAAGHDQPFLACSADPASRSHGFYRHLGWRSTGRFDANGDEWLVLGDAVPR